MDIKQIETRLPIPHDQCRFSVSFVDVCHPVSLVREKMNKIKYEDGPDSLPCYLTHMLAGFQENITGEGNAAGVLIS